MNIEKTIKQMGNFEQMEGLNSQIFINGNKKGSFISIELRDSDFGICTYLNDKLEIKNYNYSDKQEIFNQINKYNGKTA